MTIHSFKPSMHEIAPYIKQAIDAGKDVRLTVTGFSMYPLLRGGSDDVILTKPETIKKYDVVLFERENGEYIFHRVIKKKGNILTIAGDNETKKEYPVLEEKVIASMIQWGSPSRMERSMNAPGSPSSPLHTTYFSPSG